MSTVPPSPYGPVPDPRDHQGTSIRRFGVGYRVICRCGWQSAEWKLESQAEDEHDHHVQIAGSAPEVLMSDFAADTPERRFVDGNDSPEDMVVIIKRLGEDLLEARELLREAMEYVDHDSWRCAHPPHYYLAGYDANDPPAGCPCGLDEFEARVASVLVDPSGENR